jgi:hypothetical protein
MTLVIDVRVYYDAEAAPTAAAWTAEASEAPGYLAVAGAFEELRALVTEGLRFHFERDDVEIVGILANESMFVATTAVPLSQPAESEITQQYGGLRNGADVASVGETIASRALVPA